MTKSSWEVIINNLLEYQCSIESKPYLFKLKSQLQFDIDYVEHLIIYILYHISLRLIFLFTLPHFTRLILFFIGYIKLQNLTKKYRFPCIMDMKMGFQAPSEKQKKKFENSTNKTHGFRICGFNLYLPAIKKTIFKDKYCN